MGQTKANPENPPLLQNDANDMKKGTGRVGEKKVAYNRDELKIGSRLAAWDDGKKWEKRAREWLSLLPAYKKVHTTTVMWFQMQDII